MLQLKKPTAVIHQSASVRYKTMILNPDGSVASERPWKNNLILDAGLNAHNTVSWADCFSVGVVGTGTDPVKRDSSTTQAARAGTTVTADANFFVSGDVGRLLKFDSGEECYITAYIDPLNVTVNVSGTVASSQFTVWYVNQTGLVAESKRTSTYSQNGGDNGTTFSVDTITMKRTYLFSAETAPVTYREIGWSYTGSAGANLFGRDLIPGVGDSLLTGQQYKVVIQLLVKISPITPTAVGDVGNNGFNTAGNIMCESVQGSSGVASNGASGRFDGVGGNYAGLEPNIIGQVYFITSNWTQKTSPITGDALIFTATAKTTTKGSYTNGNFYVDFTSATLGVSEGNGTIYGLAILGANGGFCHSLKFTTPQTKDSDHTLTTVWRLSWNRTLANT